MTQFDAIVLAGGTARRLGGTPKHGVVVDGQTLLARTLAAVDDAQSVIIVGDDTLRPLVGTATVVREDPPLSGPAAGIGAALPFVHAEWVVVLACDYPQVGEIVPVLVAECGGDGVIAVDASDRRQNLLFVARTVALKAAADRLASLAGTAVHALIEPLDLIDVPMPDVLLRDVDEWKDLEHDR